MGSKKAKTAGTRLETEPADVEETPIKVRPHRVRSRSLSTKRRPIPNPTAFARSEKKRNPNEGHCYHLNAPSTPMKRSLSDEVQTEFERAQLELEKRFTHIESLATTKTSVIYRALDKTTNTICVVKHLNDRYLTSHERQKTALLEYKNAFALKSHPHVVHYEWYLQSGPFIYFQMEYCLLGSLEGYLARNKLYDEEKKREKDIVWNFFLDILLGLTWIHKNGFVHLDIKPANIFLVPKSGNHPIPTLKIGDFGLSRRIGSTQRNKLEKVKKGDGRYLAPELLDKSKVVSEVVDIYSLGITLLEMAADYKPSTALWEEIRAGYIATEKVSDELARILRRMLCTDPSLRPTTTTLYITSEKLQAKGTEFGISISTYDDLPEELHDDKKMEEMMDVYKESSASEGSDLEVEEPDSEDTLNENANPNKPSFDSVKKKLF